MLKRIYILTLLQLGNKIGVKENVNKKKVALGIFLRALLVLGICAGIYFALGFIKSTLYLPINMGMLTFLLFISQILSIISSTTALMNSLYNSKDNAILLSYPAKHNEVFISKLIVEYLRELKKSIFLLLPLLIAFGLVSGGALGYYIFSIILLFLLPLFPVLLGSLLSIPLALIKRLIDRVPVIYLFLLVGVVVGIFLLIGGFLSGIPRPLRLIVIYNKFINGTTSFIVSANSYALYCVLITNVLYGINSIVSLLILVGVIAVLVVLIYFISMPLYFGLASFTKEHSIKATTKEKQNSNQRPTFFAFLRKEFLLSVRSLNQVISNYSLIIFAPLILYVMNVVFSAIPTSSLGDSMIVMFNILVGGSLILASNTQSASAITTEGSEIVLMKTAPSNTANMVWAKLFVNIFVSTILIIISGIIMIASGVLPPLTILGIFFILIMLNGAHIMWSLQLDIVSPKLRDYAETGRVDNANISFSMTLGLIITLLMSVLTLFLMIDDLSTAWIKLIGIVIAFFALRLYFLIINVKAYFKRIEF